MNNEKHKKAYSFLAALKDCSQRKDIQQGSRLHAEILCSGLLGKIPSLASALISMYSKCGLLGKSQDILDELPVRSVICWNALITAYTQQGLGLQALSYFQWMQYEGVTPNAVTFTCILKVCGYMGMVDKGKQIHDDIVKSGLLEKDIVLGTALVNMYAKCGALSRAEQVLRELPTHDTISWSALISGYVQEGHYDEALSTFECMQQKGISPDGVTFISILKACGHKGALGKGKKIHDEITSHGLLENDIVLGNSLVDMYVKCGVLEKAHGLLYELPVRDAVSWNTLIAGYTKQDRVHEALTCFEQMQSEGISSDAVTFVCIAKACGRAGTIEKGEQVHNEVLSRGLLKKHIVLSNALIDMYVKCGVLAKAQEVLDEIPTRNVISWSSLIAGYADRGGHEAFDCFEQMKIEGIAPNSVTFICILKACCGLGAIDNGKQIHTDVIKSGLMETDVLLGTALVDMYSKCGILSKARQVLDELPIRDVISWNALISGYAEHGQCYDAFSCFEQMQNEGLSPSVITFLCILTACSHSGLLCEAQVLFGSMTERHGIAASIEHHTCMVVVYGCAGNFDDAISVIKVMPSCEYPAVWRALLGACRKWGNVRLGKLAFDQALQLDSGCAAIYILMANIFTAAGMQADAQNIEAMRIKYATSNRQQTSVWVDASGMIHSYASVDKNTKYSNKKTNSGGVFMRHNSLAQCGHSIKVAVSCALIDVNEEEIVHVASNACICHECHSAISSLSKREHRKIMVRDPTSLHVFEIGKCTNLLSVP